MISLEMIGRCAIMSEKILVVDDEEEIVTFIRDALTDEGYRQLLRKEAACR